MTLDTAGSLDRIDEALNNWEQGQDAAAWCADGGPDELASGDELVFEESLIDGITSRIWYRVRISVITVPSDSITVWTAP